VTVPRAVMRQFCLSTFSIGASGYLYGQLIGNVRNNHRDVKQMLVWMFEGDFVANRGA
jgi:hypothetical protein